MLIIWVDPRTLSLSDFENALNFSNLSGTPVGSGLSQTFVYAIGNIDLIATPLFGDANFQLILAAGSSALRAGYVVAGGRGAPVQVPVTTSTGNPRTIVNIDAVLNLVKSAGSSQAGPKVTPEPSTPSEGQGSADSPTIVPPANSSGGTGTTAAVASQGGANRSLIDALNESAPTAPNSNAPNGTIGGGTTNTEKEPPPDPFKMFLQFLKDLFKWFMDMID